MRCQKHTFILVALLACACTGFTQVRKSPRSSSFSVPRVNANKARIMCPIFVNSRYPYQGIGFKLGDPFALTYKFYANKHFSFAAPSPAREFAVKFLGNLVCPGSPVGLLGSEYFLIELEKQMSSK